MGESHPAIKSRDLAVSGLCLSPCGFVCGRERECFAFFCGVCEREREREETERGVLKGKKKSSNV
jgi:hypothetical protein